MAQKQKYKLLDGGKSEKSRKKQLPAKKKKKSSGKAAGYSYAVATPGEWLRANLGVLIASIVIRLFGGGCPRRGVRVSGAERFGRGKRPLHE